MRGALIAPAGDPTALAACVDRYEASERAIAAAAEELMRVVIEGKSLSIDAVHGSASTASGHLNQAHGRYQGTRSALRSYTVELVIFHAAATEAIERDQAAHLSAQAARQDLTDAAHHARTAALNPQDQATMDHWHTQAYLARHRIDAAEDLITQVGADYSKAAEAFEQAAQRAIALIEASFDGTNDSGMDRLKHALGEAVSFLSSLVNWVADFFQAAFALIGVAVAILVIAVLLAVAVIALIAVLAVLLVAALALIVNMVIGLLATLLVLLTVGGVAYDIATKLGVDDLTRIRVVLAALAFSCPALGYFLLSRIRGEALKASLEVSRFDLDSIDDPTTAGPTAAENALAQLEASAPDSVDDFLWQAGAMDTIGGGVQTVVDIARIVQEGGSVAWIVTLPSTKDWVVPADQGAVNDLDADLLLLAFPGLKSQYEKAVLDAMEQAGIGHGEPVLLTGWSLGGILAGHLAETGAGGYDYAGVVVAGAPIDHLSISQDIPVIQVKHTTDPVHRTDMIDAIPDHGAHISLWDGDRSGIGLGLKTDVLGHNALQYRQTLEEHVTANESINDSFRDFYVVDDPNHTGKPKIEHTQYAFSE